MNELSPVLQIFIITIIVVEGWWIWFSYPADERISFAEFLLLEFLVVSCLVLVLFYIAAIIKSRFIPLLPIVPLLFYFIIVKLHVISEIRYEDRMMKNEIIKASRINSSQSFERIGDIYFSKSDFENAILWYRKAKSITENPEITEKIESAKKEILIKQKKLWICSECSMTNSNKYQKCKYCGTLKPSLHTLKKEVFQTSKNLKKDLILFIIMLIAIPFFMWFMKNAGFFMSFIFFCVLFVPLSIYFLYKFFSR